MNTKQCKVCGIIKRIDKFRVVKVKNRPPWTMGKCSDCDNFYQKQRNHGVYKQQHKQIQKNYKLKLRKAVIDIYGGKCECCGEATEEFLQIDHIDGKGHIHRKLIKKDLYKFLKDENYPKDNYRLLCSNCNFSLGIRGYCPHGDLHQNRPSL